MLRLVGVSNFKTKKLLNLIVLIIFLVFSALFYSSITFAGSSNVYVKDLEISPNYAVDKTMFASTAGAGIFKTIDGGQNWNQLSLGNGFNSTHTWIKNLLISPAFSSDNTLIANLYNSSSRKSAILISLDGGKTWTVSGGMDFDNIAISPNYALDKAIFGENENNKTDKSSLYRSTDNGKNWVVTAESFTTKVGSIKISPKFDTDNTIFATADYGIYRSTNGGTNWSRILKSSLRYHPSDFLHLSPNFANDKTIFADYNDGLIKSVDGGQTWRILQNGIVGTPTGFSISPDYENDSTIFLVTDDLSFLNWTSNIFKSNDNGQTWSKIFTRSLKTSNEIKNLTISPDFKNDNSLFLSSFNGGLSKSSDGGVNWIDLNNGLSKLNTRLTISSNRKVIRKGMSIVLTVRLKKQDGSVFPNRVISIEAIEDVLEPEEELIKNVRTNEKGAFRLKVSPKKTTTYYADFDGDYKFEGMGSKIKIKVLR